jgi:hypothetical protein
MGIVLRMLHAVVRANLFSPSLSHPPLLNAEEVFSKLIIASLPPKVKHLF